MIRLLPKKLSIAMFISGLSFNVMANEDWNTQLLQRLEQSSQWQQLNALQRIAEVERLAADQPLYNPELEFSYEDKTEPAYQITLSQTIDLFDKRETLSQRALITEQINNLDTQLKKTQLLEQAVVAVLESRRADALHDLSETQLKISERLIQLTQQRVHAGDANQIDLQLVRLAHAEALEAQNTARRNTLESQANTALLLGTFKIELPTSFDYNPNLPPDLITLSEQSLPSQIALLETQKSQLGVVKTAKESRAEPTIGLGFGEDGDDNVVALTLSIPLNVRNTYRAEIDAAKVRTEASDRAFQLAQQQSHNALKRSWATLTQQREIQQLFAQAQQQSMQRLNQQLEKLWRLGELDTTQYLQNLQQSNSALKAQINLNTETDLALINWLSLSNQLQSWLTQR